VLVIFIDSALLLFTSQVKYAPSLVAGILLGFSLSVLFERLPQSGLAVWGAPLAGFLLYALIDRFVHPVCAFCQEQDRGSRWPLAVMAAALGCHSLMDGALLGANETLRWAVVAHWIPEAIAVFWLLRSIAGKWDATVAYTFVQSMVVVGYLAANQLPFAAEATLAVTGAMLYLALHGLHEAYERSPRSLWVTGAAAAAVAFWVH
jgi:zinc transporter ZupT